MTRSSRPPASAGPAAAPRGGPGTLARDAVVPVRAPASPTVSTQWLCDHLGSDTMIVLDATVLGQPNDFRSGLAGHLRSHVPSAVFADLLQFSDPAAPHPFTRPSAEHFEQATRRLGITDDILVVVYDSAYGQWAARLWWLFRSFGFDRVSVLDGGFTKWSLEERPVESSAAAASPPVVAPGSPHLFRAEERSGFWADKPYVQSIADGRVDAVLLSAVPEASFSAPAGPAADPSAGPSAGTEAAASPPLVATGDTAPADATVPHRATLPGHIPGSVNVPAAYLVDVETHALLRRDDLRRALEPVLSRSTRSTATAGGTLKRSDASATSYGPADSPAGGELQIVAYCGDGVSAATDALALAVLGHTAVSIYDGSLSEWIADPLCPLAGGAAA